MFGRDEQEKARVPYNRGGKNARIFNKSNEPFEGSQCFLIIYAWLDPCCANPVSASQPPEILSVLIPHNCGKRDRADSRPVWDHWYWDKRC